MAEERIDSLFDVPAILKERDTVLAAMKSITDEMAKSTVDASKQKSILTDAKTAKEAAAAITQVDAETKKLSNSTKKLSDEQNALNRLNKTLVRTQVQQSEAGQKVVNALDRERAELKAISFERQKAIQQERSQADYTRAFAKELDLASMNISEMQRELSRLNAMSFKGLDPAQIATVKARMAELTDGIGDFQTRVKIASTDAIPSVTNALSGLVGIAQGVTGTLAIFGVENKKLEQTMVGLISVSMALKAAQEMHEGRTLKVAAATIKSAYATTKDTIATYANSQAKAASTKVVSGLWKIIAANPMLALVAGIAAVTVGIIAMVNAMKPAQNSFGKLAESQSEIIDAAVETNAKLTMLGAKINEVGISEDKRNKAIREYNIIAKEAGLRTLEYSAATSDLNAAMVENLRLLYARAFYDAASKQMQEMTAEYIKQYQKVKDNSDMVKFLNNAYKEQMNDMMSLQRVLEPYLAQQESNIDITNKLAGGIKKVTTEIEKNTTATEALKKLKTIQKDYQDYIVLLDDLERGVISSTEAFNSLSKMYADGTITAKEFASANEEILESLGTAVPDKIQYTKSYIDQLSQSFSGLNKLLEEEQITSEEWAERWKALMEKTAKDTEDKAAKMKESLLSITDEAMKGFGAFVDYQNTKGDAQIQIYERQQADQQDILEQRLAAGFITQAQYDAQTAALEESYNAKKIEIERQQAQRTKALAVFDVGINTAKAIMEIWGAYAANVPLALAFSALAATTGAFQLAAINAQPLPGYAHGRDGGDAEFAYTGEQGTEAIVTNGNVFFTPPTSTLTYLPAGASVIPAPQTASMIESGLFTNSTESLSLQKLDDIEKAIRNKREFHVNITDKGVGMSAKQAANYINYINRNARI